jgi:hypothetical protein
MLAKELQAAIKNVDIEKVQELIVAGVDLGALFDNGYSPLFEAIVAAQTNTQALSIVQLFLDNNVSLSVTVPGAQADVSDMLSEIVKKTEQMMANQKKMLQMIDAHRVKTGIPKKRSCCGCAH